MVIYQGSLPGKPNISFLHYVFHIRSLGGSTIALIPWGSDVVKAKAEASALKTKAWTFETKAFKQAYRHRRN